MISYERMDRPESLTMIMKRKDAESVLQHARLSNLDAVDVDLGQMQDFGSDSFGKVSVSSQSGKCEAQHTHACASFMKSPHKKVQLSKINTYKEVSCVHVK